MQSLQPGKDQKSHAKSASNNLLISHTKLGTIKISCWKHVANYYTYMMMTATILQFTLCVLTMHIMHTVVSRLVRKVPGIRSVLAI